MSVDQVVDIAKRALWLIVETSAPLLLISLVVGLIISIFQTVTSIQDQTLTFVPKILAVFIQKCADFFEELVKSFSNYIK